MEIENDVTLKIPLVDENKSLQELINNVLSPEETEKKCQRCKSKLNRNVQFVCQPPAVLMVKINRCNDQLEEIQTAVNVEKEITFGEKQYKLISYIKQFYCYHILRECISVASFKIKFK